MLIRVIEGLRRSFLWNIQDRPSGAKCLVAWKDVCRSREEGGLGVKDLAVKNECLQLKLVHKLYSDASAPLASLGLACRCRSPWPSLE